MASTKKSRQPAARRPSDTPAAEPVSLDKPWTLLRRKVVADTKALAGRGKVFWLQLIGLVAFMTARRWSIMWAEVPIISCAPGQALYERHDGLFNPERKASLLDSILSHPSAQAGATEQLLSDAFAASRGFLLKFNREGLEQLKRHEAHADMRFLMPYIDAVRDPHANAFVLNTVLIAPRNVSVEASEATEATVSGAAIKIHRDNTLGIDSARCWLAHSVSVYYLQVPEEMVGGALELYEELPNEHDLPDGRIVPADGELVVFRGDAYHRVTAASLGPDAASPAALPTKEEEHLRVSLVLEQYRVPESSYHLTHELEVDAGLDHRDYTYTQVARAVLLGFNYVSTFVVLGLIVCGVSVWACEQLFT